MQQPVGGSTYYSSAFQPDADIDARYSSFLQGGAFHKVDSIKGHAEASGLNTISREVNTSFSVTDFSLRFFLSLFISCN